MISVTRVLKFSRQSNQASEGKVNHILYNAFEIHGFRNENGRVWNGKTDSVD